MTTRHQLVTACRHQQPWVRLSMAGRVHNHLFIYKLSIVFFPYQRLSCRDKYQAAKGYLMGRGVVTGVPTRAPVMGIERPDRKGTYLDSSWLNEACIMREPEGMRSS